ncbi:Serine/threonine-protein kinase AtPK1/AtPK6 [Pseudolycoriella hygida]|uniref:Serine/threonine-protein kinase AtPK1/AtPK6 n=1 Tax=Pseudolycoriella hygida TaxID=35572 RepID=A0A9Q0MZJ2_9DIPT|nr:Serine/threonine-protein kinase AtPK1/AtPK6 [Pseudolycoriella hygida]
MDYSFIHIERRESPFDSLEFFILYQQILELLRNCPYTSSMCYAFQTTENLFLVMEYLPGGDSFTYLDYGVLSEDVAIFYIAELIVALERMHEQNIVHCDIKTENVMIDKDGHIQLVDFGLSTKLRPRQRTNTYGGSVLYMSPEILSHSEHDTATDMWSLGLAGKFVDVLGVLREGASLRLMRSFEITPWKTSELVVEGFLKRSGGIGQERRKGSGEYYYIAPELSENNNNECGASSSRHALRNIETILELLRNCPYTSSMCYAFQTTENLFLVMEYLPGGDSFTYLDYGVLSEDVAIFYIAELIVALERMHEQNIVHCDIKTENVMIDKDGHIQLVDFGLSTKLRPRQRTNTYGGSVLYMSPEILSHSEHDTATDMWSLGVLAIVNDDPIIEGLSLEMTDFILTLLVKDPAKRPSAKEVKKHPVFKGIDWIKLKKRAGFSE